MNLRVLALVSLALVACSDELPESEPESSESSESLQREPLARVLPTGGKGMRVPSCETLQDQARRLLPAYQRCEQDSDCAIDSSIRAPCLLPFLCPIVVNPRAELASLAESAERLGATYQRFCSDQCPVARCASPESRRAYCDTATHLCKSELRAASVDASTPAPLTPVALDAGL
ncbi:MAG: hypothetical protein ABW252_19085 [Polyangiales bacterium]